MITMNINIIIIFMDNISQAYANRMVYLQVSLLIYISNVFSLIRNVCGVIFTSSVSILNFSTLF